MGKIENGAILRKNSDVELIREFDVQINPIQINTIISLENQQTKSSEKIGYLMYNQFIADKSEELNQVFKEYKDQAIDDLVLDLRYNGGGSIRNCVELASMITGQFKNDIFAKERWNKKTETYLIENFGKETILNRFVGFLQSGEQINSINLSRIFIITSSQTASASELLINGLSPYIEVIHIGGQTTGKNVGSITVYDYVDENQTKNPNHTYAMQPIVLKIANSDGYADYTDGLIPDYFAEEELQNLGSLGAKDEPLLSLALNIIQDSIVLTEKNEMFSNQFRLNNVLVTNKQEMYSDKSKLFRKDLKSKF
jgi:C-terminal processing protease CtpA/Prc